MIWLAASLIAFVIIVFLDVICFVETPYEERPDVWWRYFFGSGFIMYWDHQRRRRNSSTGDAAPESKSQENK